MQCYERNILYILICHRTVEGTGVIVDMNVSYAGGVRYLEHVECVVSVSFSPRGSLQLVLTSPQGTPSVLLQRRPRDSVSTAFDDWPFLSVHYWGEDPRGTWTLAVLNLGQNDMSNTGKFVLNNAHI